TEKMFGPWSLCDFGISHCAKANEEKSAISNSRTRLRIREPLQRKLTDKITAKMAICGSKSCKFRFCNRIGKRGGGVTAIYPRSVSGEVSSEAFVFDPLTQLR